MAKCDLAISIDRDPQALRPGERFSGEVAVSTDSDVRCDALTLELRWATDGKGRENAEVVESWTLFEGDLRMGTRQSFRFETRIPRRGPSSYLGKLLRVDWELRARADVPWAIDAKATLPLRVANRALHDAQAQETDRDLAPEDEDDDYEEEDEEEGGGAGELKLVVPARGRGFQPRPEILVPALMVVVLGFALAAGLWRPVWRMLLTVPRLVRGDAGWSDAPALIFGPIILLVAVAVGWALLRDVLIRRRLGEVHYEIEPEIVRPGDRVRCSVRFTPQASLQVAAVTACLRARERCERGSGKSRKVFHHTAIEQSSELSPARAVSPGLPYEVRGEIQVPADAPSSFSSRDNRLEWTVDLAIRIPRWPDWTRKRILVVVP